MKKLGSFLLVTLLSLSLVVSGCGQDPGVDGGVTETSGEQSPSEQPSDGEASGETEESETPSGAPLKVALLLAGPISDQGWNATAYQGLERIKAELGAETNYQESVQQSDMEEIFRGYALEGYNIVIGHGFQFGDAAAMVATEFPDVIFAVTSSDVFQEPNLASINNHNQQQGFLAGAFCALMSDSGKIASVNGMEIPSIMAFDRGFMNGAEYAVPGIQADTMFTGDFYDAAKAKEAALAFINSGVDIITHDADAAGLGVIEAAQEKDIFCVGSISDQNSLAPETIVVSALSNLSDAIFVFAKDVSEGSFKAQSYMMGINEECVGLSPYHGLEDQVSQEIKDKMIEITTGIADGSIDINAGQGNGSQ